MKQVLEHSWPPLIRSAQVPWFIRARDWILTILAWIALAFSLRLGLLFLWDYFSDPIFELTRMKAPDWSGAWQRLSPFLYMILAVVIWIVVWGVGRRAQLLQDLRPDLEQAAEEGVGPGPGGAQHQPIDAVGL